MHSGVLGRSSDVILPDAGGHEPGGPPSSAASVLGRTAESLINIPPARDQSTLPEGAPSIGIDLPGWSVTERATDAPEGIAGNPTPRPGP
jgi:hypothetical protein